MVAVDTNLLIRLLTADEPRQTAVAKSLFASQSIWIAKTVLLETEDKASLAAAQRAGATDVAVLKA
jgi:predicted nucleic-acid-binding protein